MLTIYHAARLEQLAGHWLQLRSTDRLPVLQLESVVVGHEACGDWLSQFLATADGVAANIRFELPAAAIWRLMRQLIATLPERSALGRRELQLRCYRALCDFEASVDPSQAIRRWHSACAYADVFDQYLVYRSDLLLEFESGKHTSTQARLWRSIAAELPENYHRAQCLEQATGLLENSQQPLALSPLRLFNVQGLSPDYLRFLSALSRHTSVDFLQLNPSTEYWLDPQQASAHLSTLDTDAARVEMGNPLLDALGKSLRDQLRLLIESPEIQHEVLPSPPLHDNHLLHAVNQSILNDSASLSASVQKDRSLELVNCHTPVRELQMLRDYLLAQVADDPSLVASDIVVMAPDINRYTPYIDSVFLDSSASLPFSVADRAIESELNAIPLFLRLLEAKTPDIEIDTLMALLEHPDFLSAHQLDDRAKTRIESLLAAHNTLVGDAELGRLNAGSLGHLISRSVISALGAEDQTSVGDWLCDSRSSIEDWPLLEALTTIAERFAQYHEAAQSDATMTQWVERWHALWQDCFATGAQAEQERKLLDQASMALFEAVAAAQCTLHSYDQAVATAMLSEELAQNRFGRRFLQGDISFCSLLPMRSIPHRIVCILGLNDGEFPRQHQPQDFDLIAQKPRLGDRSRRCDDRQLFLEALLAARQALYLSYVGRSADGKAQFAPSLVISQLQRFLADNEVELEAFMAPLHEFDQAQLPFPWRQTQITAPGTPKLTEAPASDQAHRILNFSDLLSFYKDPSLAYLRAQGMALPFHPRLPHVAPLEKPSGPTYTRLLPQAMAMGERGPWVLGQSGELGAGNSAREPVRSLLLASDAYQSHWQAADATLSCQCLIEARSLQADIRHRDLLRQERIYKALTADHRAYFALYLQQMLANACDHALCTEVFCISDSAWQRLAPLEAEHARAQLCTLLELADTGLNQALALFAKTSPKLCAERPSITNWRSSTFNPYGEYDANPAICALFSPDIIDSEQASSLAKLVYGEFVSAWETF